MAALDDAYVLDFHTHWRPPSWKHSGALVLGESDPREDLDALSVQSAASGIDKRALTAPVESLFGPDGGHGGLLYAADQLVEYRAREGADALGANLYFDTMRFHPPVLRYLGEVLGAGRIIVGSDRPIHRDAERSHIDRTLAAAGLTPEQQELIRIGNARRRFGLHARALAA